MKRKDDGENRLGDIGNVIMKINENRNQVFKEREEEINLVLNAPLPYRAIIIKDKVNEYLNCLYKFKTKRYESVEVIDRIIKLCGILRLEIIQLIDPNCKFYQYLIEGELYYSPIENFNELLEKNVLKGAKQEITENEFIEWYMKQNYYE